MNEHEMTISLIIFWAIFIVFVLIGFMTQSILGLLVFSFLGLVTGIAVANQFTPKSGEDVVYVYSKEVDNYVIKNVSEESDI